MSNKPDTIDTIVDDMLNEGHTGPADELEWVQAKMKFYADRIKAAWKRQEKCYLDQIRDAINQWGHEKYKAEHAPVGDAAAMREALELADRELRAATEDDTFGDDRVYLVGCMLTVAGACRAALAAPPRQCDKGTPDEQYKRFRDYCYSKRCENLTTPKTLGSEFAFKWAQMPYEEGGEK